MVNDGLTDAFSANCTWAYRRKCCEQWGLSREELDEFSAKSQQKAAKSERRRPSWTKSSLFSAIKKDVVNYVEDEGIRADATAEVSKLSSGNQTGRYGHRYCASTINDGAAAIGGDGEKARQLGVTPEAIWLGGAGRRGAFDYGH